MLSAVQNFVADSFDSSGTMEAGLGRLEYGNMKIIIKHGEHLFLTGIFEGAEHPDMEMMLKRTIDRIEKEHGQILESRRGNISQVIGVQSEIEAISNARFLVRRDLEGVKLENERLRIADLVYEKLAAMSKEKSLLLLLRDIHWADESSLFVLNYLARNIGKQKIMILGTCRPDESQSLEATLTKMHGEDIIDKIALEKLGPEEIIRLIDTVISPNDFPEDFLQKISSQCEGNPFFIIEMLRHMMAEGSIIQLDDKFTITGNDYSIPGNVEEVVHRRLDKLEPDAMAMVEYMACIGRDFDTSTVMAMQSLGNPEIAFEKLIRNGIIMRDNGQASFSHTIFHDVTYQGIGQRWKQSYHRSLGEYFETLYNEEDADVLYDLARHFSNSKEHEKTFNYCYMAGEKAEGSFAAEYALKLYSDALTALPHIRNVDKVEQEIIISERLGDLYRFVGRYDDAIINFRKASEIIENGEIKARMHRKCCEVFDLKGDYDMALQEAETGQTFLNENDKEYWIIRTGIAGVLLQKGEYDMASELSEKAVEHLTGFENSEKYLWSGYNIISSCYLNKGEFDRALVFRKKNVKIWEKIGNTSKIADSYLNLGVVYWEMGDLDRAFELYENSLKIYEKIGDQSRIGITLNNMGIIFTNWGNIEKALEYYKKCLKIWKRTGKQRSISNSYNNIGEIMQYLGNLEEALDYMQKSLVVREKIGDQRGIAMAHNNIGEIMQIQGDKEGAEKYFIKSMEISKKIDAKKTYVLSLLNLSELYAGLKKIDKALALCSEAESIALEAGMKNALTMCQKVYGIILGAADDWTQAEASFEGALVSYQEMKSEKSIALTQYHWGSMICRKGDIERGKEMLEKAMNTYKEKGMKIWEEKCRTELKKYE